MGLIGIMSGAISSSGTYSHKYNPGERVLYKIQPGGNKVPKFLNRVAIPK